MRKKTAMAKPPPKPQGGKNLKLHAGTVMLVHGLPLKHGRGPVKGR